MRILITGICGFVGSRIALGLQQRIPGVRIAGVDSLIRPGTQTTRPQLATAGIAVRHGDVRCASDFETLGDCDWVIDAAANSSVLAGVDGRTSSRQLVEHNLIGTVNMLEFCKARGAGFVLLSTSRVYSVRELAALPLERSGNAFTAGSGPWPAGASPAGIAESFSTAPPVSLYGATKLASEALALEYHDAFGMPVVVNRCGVIAGAGQFATAEQGIFSFWVGSWAARRPLTYLGFDGSGSQVRDALHPDDLADLLARQLRAGPAGAGVWNVGGGPANAMSLAEMSRWCTERFGAHDVAAGGTSRKWDVPWVVMDSRRAAGTFGWQPSTRIEDILDGIARHYVDHPDWLDVSRPLH